MLCDIDADVLQTAADELLKDGLQVRTARADVSDRDGIAKPGEPDLIAAAMRRLL